MDRPRRINSALLNCPELRGISLEAEVLAHRLPLACDDFGRARLDSGALTKKLYPRHPQARGVIEYWCKELERSGFIERYRVGTEDYIRLGRWKEDQAVDDPRASDLPRSPTEESAPAVQAVVTPVAGSAGTPPSLSSTSPAKPSVGRSVSSAAADDSDEHFEALMGRLWK